jgi:V/A-type H+-transporting ATPase subunit I
VLKRLDKLNEIEEQTQRTEFTISNLSLIPQIRTDAFQPSDNLRVLAGLISSASLPRLKEELQGKEIALFIEEKDKALTFIALLATPEHISLAEKILHAVGFQNLEIPFEPKKPGEVIILLKKEIEKLKAEKAHIKNFLRKTQKVYHKKFEVLAEELEIAKQKLAALRNFKTTVAFSVLECWIPKKNLDDFHQTVKRISPQYYLEIDEKDTAPTLFDNPNWVKPFEMITELYSPPKYKDFDPTPILAITFTIFFGFMLTDAAYGLIVLSLGWIMYRGIGKFNQTMKGFAKLLMMFGASTTLLGIIFGSYFGNFFQQIGINLPIPIDSMRQVMLTLAIALGLGSMHLLIGLIAGFYDNIHRGSFKDAMAKQGVWLAFMLGLFLFLFNLGTLGLIAVAIAIILQMFFNFLEGGVVSSLLSVFGFSGFIGDLFSYARLMALAIGTAGIALAVNFMVFMVIDMIPWIGIPIAIVVFIVGHMFNVVMNGLGAFIHSTRLHFLEFFTKFYEGGGKTYKPFIADRKNTFVKLGGS